VTAVLAETLQAFSILPGLFPKAELKQLQMMKPKNKSYAKDYFRPVFRLFSTQLQKSCIFE
jgi:hypothetical protein